MLLFLKKLFWFNSSRHKKGRAIKTFFSSTTKEGRVTVFDGGMREYGIVEIGMKIPIDTSKPLSDINCATVVDIKNGPNGQPVFVYADISNPQSLFIAQSCLNKSLDI